MHHSPLPQSAGWHRPTPAAAIAPHRRDADAVSRPRQRRQAHALALLMAVSLMGGGAVMNLVDDPRPLDVQLSTALASAAQTLVDWQDQLSHGLQVSMLAVADGLDTPPAPAPAPMAESAASAPAAAPSDQ